jgi:hypothetical protein
MYRTVEERLTFMENEMNRQAFQIRLLHAIIKNSDKAGLYELIVELKLSEQTFKDLKRLTTIFEERLQDGFSVTLSSFIQHVETIFERNHEHVQFQDVSHFIPRWLGGVYGTKGFSSILHKHFYS